MAPRPVASVSSQARHSARRQRVKLPTTPATEDARPVKRSRQDIEEAGTKPGADIDWIDYHDNDDAFGRQTSGDIDWLEERGSVVVRAPSLYDDSCFILLT